MSTVLTQHASTPAHTQTICPCQVKRQLDVLDRHLATHTYMAGDSYTIADMAIWPWYGALAHKKLYV